MRSYWVKDKDTGRKISARSLNFGDLSSCVGSLWSTMTQICINDATAVIVSQMFLVCQNYSARKHLLESNLLHTTLYSLTSI